MSTPKFRAVQKTGTYENAKGETKNNYQDLGVIFENDKGHLSLKLNALPLPNDKGEVWINLFSMNNEKSKGNK